jgi:hypothetical protein
LSLFLRFCDWILELLKGVYFPCFMIQFKKYLHIFAKCYQKRWKSTRQLLHFEKCNIIGSYRNVLNLYQLARIIVHVVYTLYSVLIVRYVFHNVEHAFQIYLTNHCFCFVLRLFLLNTGSKIFCYTGRSLYSARISLAKYCLRYRCFFENKLCWFIIVTMRCHTDETFRKHGAIPNNSVIFVV